MRMLALEASGPAASVCLWEDGRVRGEWYQNDRLTHSETLLYMAKQLLDNAGLGCGGLDRIAVSAGPGSFTGVRIGVAAAKGLALPHETPCVGVSTLEALARQLSFFDGVVCAVLDARCRQVYNALFSAGGGELTRLCPDRALAITDLENELKNVEKRIILVGDGAELCYNILDKDKMSLSLAPAHLRFQRAAGVALAAETAETVTPDELLPIYLRLPQAERERIQKSTEGKK